MVIKPAEDTPLSAIYLGQLARDIGFPDGVINVVTGMGETAGAAVAGHPGFKRMTFTGSPEVGRLVAEACGRNLTPCKLELGGKGAAVVFDDVDVAATARKLADAITFHTGQVCCDATRWLVHEKIYDQFVSESVACLKQIKVGYQMDAGVQMGPVVSEKQQARVLGYLDRGRAQGAELVLAGGAAKVSGQEGFYVKPALLAGSLDNVAAQEEIFGPVAYLAPFKRREAGDPDGQRDRLRAGQQRVVERSCRVRRASRKRWSRATAGSTPTTSSRTACRTAASTRAAWAAASTARKRCSTTGAANRSCGRSNSPRSGSASVMAYRAGPARYDTMLYRDCGRSGLKLPVMSLGLWQNFGANRDYSSAVEILGYAFDSGITHFDLANNYGPPPGASEELLGQVMARDLRPYRDELIISTKAGYRIWPGPYGEFGSRKNLLASLDRSLARLGLEYVDIFYSHRYDPNTPLEETMSALAQAVRQGKALYIGISSYPEKPTREAHRILKEMGVPIILHQPSYSVINRWIEQDHTIDACGELGIGVIAFSPLSQGVLSGKYSSSNRAGTRGENPAGPLRASHVEPRVLAAVDRLSEIARARGQSLVQLALAWVLRRPEVTSTLIGVRNLDQLKENLAALANLGLSPEEIAAIDDATRDGQINLYPTHKSWLS